LLVLTFPRAKVMSTIIVGKFFTTLSDLNKSHVQGALVHGVLALGETLLLSIITNILGQAVSFSFFSFCLNVCWLCATQWVFLRDNYILRW
jgi:hypothetical protein